MNAKYLLAMLMPVTLILMLPNLNIGYADTDADLCIRNMSLCCKGKYLLSSFLTLNCLNSLPSPFTEVQEEQC